MNSLDPIAKTLIGLGLIFIISGLMWHFGIFEFLKLGRLPGDILIERENTKIYIPIATCILISLALSLISYLLRK